ncbi:MAG TPA: TetR/AcrR family transcriptional regulator [Candidatus Hydrogenedentes bacterium]|nr:TetR/AcrR family transcriptional regulator [Candidatus Hydrogenedentota bacterium]
MDSTLNARQRSRIETRKRLLQAGARLFAQKGVSATTAAEIARQAGVAVGTLYLHFGDKSGLLRVILNEGVENLLQAMALAADGSDERCSRQQVDLLVNFAEKNRGLCMVLFDPESIRIGATADVMDRLTRFQVDRLLGRCGAAVRPDQAYLAARAMVGMVMHGIYWWIQHDPKLEARAVADILYNLRTGAMDKVAEVL